jgi:molybdate transport system regulatory protein
MPHTHLSIRLDLIDGDRIGPGKIALLEAVRAKGSIAGAARHLGMSHGRARLLVRQINDASQQLAITTPQAEAAGGAVVTSIGEWVINLYHSIENLTGAAAFQELQEIARLTRRRPPDRKKVARQGRWRARRALTTLTTTRAMRRLSNLVVKTPWCFFAPRKKPSDRADKRGNSSTRSSDYRKNTAEQALRSSLHTDRPMRETKTSTSGRWRDRFCKVFLHLPPNVKDDSIVLRRVLPLRLPTR